MLTTVCFLSFPKKAPVAERVRMRVRSNEEGHGCCAQMVLLSAQGMDVSQIAEVTFTSPDRVREVLHNFNRDGFDSLYPLRRWAGTDVHAAATPGDQEDRAVTAERS